MPTWSWYPSAPPAKTREQAAAYAIAVCDPRDRHGQICPVWKHKASIDMCDCWILDSARRAAAGAVLALDAFDRGHPLTIDIKEGEPRMTHVAGEEGVQPPPDPVGDEMRAHGFTEVPTIHVAEDDEPIRFLVHLDGESI